MSLPADVSEAENACISTQSLIQLPCMHLNLHHVRSITKSTTKASLVTMQQADMKEGGGGAEHPPGVRPQGWFQQRQEGMPHRRPPHLHCPCHAGRKRLAPRCAACFQGSAMVWPPGPIHRRHFEPNSSDSIALYMQITTSGCCYSHWQLHGKFDASGSNDTLNTLEKEALGTQHGRICYALLLICSCLAGETICMQ